MAVPSHALLQLDCPASKKDPIPEARQLDAVADKEGELLTHVVHSVVKAKQQSSSTKNESPIVIVAQFLDTSFAMLNVSSNDKPIKKNAKSKYLIRLIALQSILLIMSQPLLTLTGKLNYWSTE